MTAADCPLCARRDLPLRRNGTFRSHPARQGTDACPGTGRKPEPGPIDLMAALRASLERARRHKEESDG